MFKKVVLLVMFLLSATNLWAVKTLNVSNTWHNLGSTGTYPASPGINEDEVCIFCHTPHGGTANTPLWNRDLPLQGVGNEFSHYTSATLSGYMKGAGMSVRQVNTESLLCLSCHDGTVALNNINNFSNRTGVMPNVLTDPMQDTSMGFGVSAVIGDPTDEPIDVDGIPAGRNLTDDHPISFSYESAQTHGDNIGQLNTSGFAKGKGIRFFGDQVNENRVECSSCHDPHVDYVAGDTAYTPFLVTPNTGSALCLACHIK